MKSPTLTLTARVKSILFQPKTIKVALPHGEMELHPVGKALSRQEYYKLMQAVGLVEAGAVMAHHGLEPGTVPAAASESNGRRAERRLHAGVIRSARELAA